MGTRDFDLSKMTVEDLFQAKRERRERLAELSFEEKIKIVKRLQVMASQVRDSKTCEAESVKGSQENQIG